MYGTTTFIAKGRPYLCVEMRSDPNMDHIDVKFLKHDTNDCFSIQIPDLKRFSPYNREFVCIDGKSGDHYEYFVFAAGNKTIDRVVIIDLISKRFTVSKIKNLSKINDIVINIMDIDPVVIGIRVQYFDHNHKLLNFYVEEYIEDLMFAFDPEKHMEHQENEVKNPEKDLDNKNRKEVETMPRKKNETKVATTPESNDMPAKKEEPTPREIISQYAEAYDNMAKDAIRGNEVFGLLSPEHRLSIAAHLDQIVEILESYIGK